MKGNNIFSNFPVILAILLDKLAKTPVRTVATLTTSHSLRLSSKEHSGLISASVQSNLHRLFQCIYYLSHLSATRPMPLKLYSGDTPIIIPLR